MLDDWTPPPFADDQPPDLITKPVPVYSMTHYSNKGMEYSIITCTTHNIQCTLWTWLNSIIVQGLVPRSLLQYHTDQGAQTWNNGGSPGMEMEQESRLHAICARFQWVAWPLSGHWRIGRVIGVLVPVWQNEEGDLNNVAKDNWTRKMDWNFRSHAMLMVAGWASF